METLVSNLKALDVKQNTQIGFKAANVRHVAPSRTFLAEEGEAGPVKSFPVEGTEDDEASVSTLDTEGEQSIYLYLEASQVEEGHVLEPVDTLVQSSAKKKPSPPPQGKWALNKKLKRAGNSNRKYYGQPGKRGDVVPSPSGGKHRSATGVVRPRKRRLPLEELIARTCCAICKKQGHWKNECPDRGVGFVLLAAASAYCAMTAAAEEFILSLQEIVLRNDVTEATFLTIKAGFGLVDTAAGSALLGLCELLEFDGRLREHGFQAVYVGKSTTRAVGVGGAVTPLGNVLLPTFIVSMSGFIEFSVLPVPTPCLLPIPFIKMMKDVMDTVNNKLNLQELGVSAVMHDLSSSHVAIDLIDVGARPLLAELPSILCTEYPWLRKEYFLASSEISDSVSVQKCFPPIDKKGKAITNMHRMTLIDHRT